nr:MAG TPA: hypothetical protein [Caudoviricetes sp.]
MRHFTIRLIFLSEPSPKRWEKMSPFSHRSIFIKRLIFKS